MVPFDSMAVWRWESYLWPYLLAVSTQYANVTLSHRMTARAALYCLARPQSRCKNTLNPLMGTLKPQSNGPLYSSTVIGTLAVDGQAVTYGTAPSPLLAVPNVSYQPTHQQPVYQLHIIRVALIASALYKGLTDISKLQMKSETNFAAKGSSRDNHRRTLPSSASLYQTGL